MYLGCGSTIACFMDSFKTELSKLNSIFSPGLATEVEISVLNLYLAPILGRFWNKHTFFGLPLFNFQNPYFCCCLVVKLCPTVHDPRGPIYSSSGTLSTKSSSLNLFFTSTAYSQGIWFRLYLSSPMVFPTFFCLSLSFVIRS